MRDIIFPAHKCGLHLSHNEHRNYYEELQEFIDHNELAGDFESSDAMQRAIDTDECWVLQWYPNTPIGFFRVAAPSFDEVVALALAVSASGKT